MKPEDVPRKKPFKAKLQPFLDSGQMEEDVSAADADGIGFTPIPPPQRGTLATEQEDQTMILKTNVRLSSKFTEAVDYAREQHANQVRKGSNIPYLYHPLGVTSLVLEYGGDEDQAIAGMLHDVIEDQGAHHEVVIRERFGSRVAEIVLACTDGTAEGKALATTSEAKIEDWRRRKLRYIEHLRRAEPDALLVSYCDKLHNARAIVDDLSNPEIGPAVFDRFTGRRDGTLRYYQSVSEIFTQRNVPGARALDATVSHMHALAGVVTRAALS